ncbi:MAG: hypothetical protein M3068_06780 [Gemmatimonadota bacterium]|nr:hypothetical protein [Gemmatimonadota bacterium]
MMSDGPSDSLAIVAGHGDFAAGMVSAVEQITGRGDRFVSFSNRGLSAQGVEEALSALVQERGIRVIFTDLPAGSTTLAARRIGRTFPHVMILTGVSLVTLLQFATRMGPVDREQLRADAERGRQGLQLTEAPPSPAPATGSERGH